MIALILSTGTSNYNTITHISELISYFYRFFQNKSVLVTYVYHMVIQCIRFDFEDHTG